MQRDDAPAPRTAPPTVVGGSSSTAAAPAPTQPATMNTVDVEAMLEGMAAKFPRKVNWRTSIVDLMALVGIDNSRDMVGQATVGALNH